ncbi:MAG: hypothetical protein ACSLFK_16660, partial [Gemmatimonadaceae bacterium]
TGWFLWTKTDGLTLMSEPAGVRRVSPTDVNSRGDVVGSMLVESGGTTVWHAFIWSPSRGYSDLGAAIAEPGEPVGDSRATAIDDDGTVAGYYYVGRVKHAFLWTEATGVRFLPIQLPYLGGIFVDFGRVAGNLYLGGIHATPYRLDLTSNRLEELSFSSEVGGSVNGLNAKGEAVGYDGYLDHGFGGSADAVMWDASGQKTTAMACGTENDCFAYLHGINLHGVALGTVRRNYGDTRVFRWSRSAGVEFLDIPDPSPDNGAVAVNDDGTMLVFSRHIGYLIAPSGSRTALEPLRGGGIIRPVAMSQDGRVVGMTF